MSLTSLLRQNKDFRAMIDAGVPSEWLKAFRVQIPSEDPQDSPPGLLHPWECGLLCDFAIRKLLRDGQVPVRLLPWSETGMLESVAGQRVRVPGDCSAPMELLRIGMRAPSPDLLDEAEAWLQAYLARPLPECLVETIMLSYPEAYYRSGRWDASLLDMRQRKASLKKNARTIWAWLKPILGWVREALRGAQQAILNPEFGQASRLVGGADADLWIDGYLLDIKYVRKVSRGHIRQLIGYAALARLEDRFWRENVRGIGLILPRQRAFVRAFAPAELDMLSRRLGQWLERRQQVSGHRHGETEI